MFPNSPRGMEGADTFLGNSNTDSICQAKGEPGQAPEPLLPLKQTNKQYEEIRCVLQFKESIHLASVLFIDFYRIRLIPILGSEREGKERRRSCPPPPLWR